MTIDPANRVVFRCDASVQLGGGHVARSLALARAFAEDGRQVGFAVNPDALAVIPELKQWDHCVVPDRSDTKELKNWLPEGCDLLVVDHYGLDKTFESSLRGWATRVLILDDLADRPHDADFLVDQTLGRDPQDYAHLISGDCTLLTGPAFALLRSQFRQARPQALSQPLNRPCRRLLIACGLGDHLGLTLTTLRALALHPNADLSIDVIIGGGCPTLPELRALADKMPQTVSIMTDVQDVATHMLDADLCIGAAGSSSWERCAMALPTLFFVAVPNQEMLASALDRSGAAISLGKPGELTEAELGLRIHDLVSDDERRAAIANSAARICDGRGTGRVLNATSPLKAKSGEPIALRGAGAKDIGEVFDWQNDSETRRYFRNPSAPNRNEHNSWWAQRLARPDPAINIVTCNGEPAGLVRLDPDPEGFEVSILVAPGFRGKGIGGAALRLLRRLEPDATFVASVHPQNLGSVALFAKAGYIAAGGDRLISRNGDTA